MRNANTSEVKSYFDDDNTMETLNDDESVTSAITDTSFDEPAHGGDNGGDGVPTRTSDPIKDLLNVSFLRDEAIMRQCPELRNMIDEIVKMNETVERKDEATRNQVTAIVKQAQELRDVYEETVAKLGTPQCAYHIVLVVYSPLVLCFDLRVLQIDDEELQYAIELLELSEPELVLIKQMRNEQQKAAAVEHQRRVQEAIAQMSDAELQRIDDEIHERARIQAAAWQRQSTTHNAQVQTTDNTSSNNNGATQ